MNRIKDLENKGINQTWLAEQLVKNHNMVTKIDNQY